VTVHDDNAFGDKAAASNAVSLPPSSDVVVLNNSSPSTAVVLGKQQLSAYTLLQHPSDTQIKPIVGNKNIETFEKFAYKESSLPFVAYACESMTKHTQSELEAHLTIVYKALQRTYIATNSQQAHLANASNQSLLQDRIRILSYLLSIAASTEV